MSENKYGHRFVNWFVSIVDKLGGEEKAEAFLRDELVISKPIPEPSITEVVDYAKLAQYVAPDGTITMENIKKCLVPRWHVDENGWIRFSLTSTGTTREEWIAEFVEDLGDEAKFMLCSGAFQPSPAGTVYDVAVLPGKLWNDAERITKNIRAYCDDHSLKHGKEMNLEIVCLIRRTFSNEEIAAMGLTWIIGLHEPISGSGGDPHLLGAHRDYGARRLDACYGKPAGRWLSDDGFASVVSQVSHQVLES